SVLKSNTSSGRTTSGPGLGRPGKLLQPTKARTARISARANDKWKNEYRTVIVGHSFRASRPLFLGPRYLPGLRTACAGGFARVPAAPPRGQLRCQTQSAKPQTRSSRYAGPITG